LGEMTSPLHRRINHQSTLGRSTNQRENPR